MTLELVRATGADIPFVMSVERLEGYDALVGRWDEARHHAALADPRHTYFVGSDGGEPVGFAILRDWAAPERVTQVRRLAVRDPGRGHGRRLLRAVVDAVFAETDAHRVWLGTFPDNLRARRTYEALGFVPEGISRGSAFFGGVQRDELIMAVLRTEWRPAQPCS